MHAEHYFHFFCGYCHYLKLNALSIVHEVLPYPKKLIANFIIFVIDLILVSNSTHLEEG